MGDEPLYHGMVGIDIEGFGRPDRTDPVRNRLRRRLYGMVDEALEQAEIAPALVTRKDTGDGMLLLVDPKVSLVRLVSPLVTTLAGRVAEGDRRTPEGRRLRLRLVVHGGAVLADPHGHTGDDLLHAFRLLDAEATRAVLAGSPSAVAVLMVSEEVYQRVVRHGYAGIDPAGWQPVLVSAKETRTRAWVHLPGLDVQPPLPDGLAAAETESAGGAAHQVRRRPPRELPRPPADFTGRDDELAVLRRLLEASTRRWGSAQGPDADGPPPPPVIGMIDGMGGVGKSALALQVAGEMADQFPDGQLYLDLQGTTEGMDPLDPLEALERLLRALGLEQTAIPTDLPEAAARFRSLAAERRLLLVLDNAHNPRQVRQLLPGSSTCGVLITSRQPLTVLEGSRATHLDVLPHDQALELLGRVAGRDRVGAEPEAAAEVVRWCGRLPLALRIAGARLAARPAWPVWVLAGRLANSTRRLEEFAVGDLALHASFDVSLRALTDSPDAVDRSAIAAFCLTSIPDGPDVSLPAATALLRRPEAATEVLLERLVDAQLLEARQPGRYRFHDLLRLCARQHAVSSHPASERTAALTRVLDFYADAAGDALALLRPGDRRTATTRRQRHDGVRFPDTATALAWLDVERPNLLAAVSQAAAAAPAVPADRTVLLTSAMSRLLSIRGYLQDGVQANEAALELARRTHDRAAQARIHNDLGAFFRGLGRYTDAAASHEQGLRLFQELGDLRGQGDSLSHLGRVHRRLGRYEEALACQEQSVALLREHGDAIGEATALHNLGVIYRRLGRYEEAVASHQASLELHRTAGDRWGQAFNLAGLGTVYCLLGRFREATSRYRESLRIYRQLGDRLGEAYNLHGLGVVHERLGDYGEALIHQRNGLTIRQELGDRRGEAISLGSLGAVHERLGHHGEALAYQRDSLSIRQQLGDRHGQVEALRDLGDALAGVGRRQEAEAAWGQALDIAEALRIPETGELRARLAAPKASVTPADGGG